VAFLGLALYVPFLRSLFRFSTLHPIDLGICLAAGTASILWFEWLKVLNGRQRLHPDQRVEQVRSDGRRFRVAQRVDGHQAAQSEDEQRLS
jgi:hypothetical protein